MNRPPGPWEGTHVKVLLRHAKFELLNSVGFIDELLDRLVYLIGMQPIGKMVKDVPLEVGKLGREVFEDEGGVTGVVVLSTSHCAIHTWPLRGSASLDVYSCRKFDFGIIESCLRVKFGVSEGDLIIKDISNILTPPDEWLAEEAEHT